MMMTWDVNCNFSPLRFWWTLLSLNLDIPIAANGGAIEKKKTKTKKQKKTTTKNNTHTHTHTHTHKRNCIVDSDKSARYDQGFPCQ